MKILEKVKNEYLNSDITAEQALKEIFNVYLLPDNELKLYGLEVRHVDYGIYQLRQNGDYLIEGDKTYCLEQAKEIMDKMNENYEEFHNT